MYELMGKWKKKLKGERRGIGLEKLSILLDCYNFARRDRIAIGLVSSLHFDTFENFLSFDDVFASRSSWESEDAFFETAETRFS